MKSAVVISIIQKLLVVASDVQVEAHFFYSVANFDPVKTGYGNIN
jgi:hypothetical protein